MTFGHPKPLEAGVEIYVSNADDFARDNGIEVAAHFTRVIWFRWGASFPELYSASVISAALASIGGKVYFDEEGRFKTTEEIAAEALSVLRFIKP